jgi:hypothetical protein
LNEKQEEKPLFLVVQVILSFVWSAVVEIVITALEINIYIPHNYGDRHRNFEDSMFFLKCPFHSFYI